MFFFWAKFALEGLILLFFWSVFNKLDKLLLDVDFLFRLAISWWLVLPELLGLANSSAGFCWLDSSVLVLFPVEEVVLGVEVVVVEVDAVCLNFLNKSSWFTLVPFNGLFVVAAAPLFWRLPFELNLVARAAKPLTVADWAWVGGFIASGFGTLVLSLLFESEF